MIRRVKRILFWKSNTYIVSIRKNTGVENLKIQTHQAKFVL